MQPSPQPTVTPMLAVLLRYQLPGQFSFYGGVVWARLPGATAEFARAEEEDLGIVQYVAGLHWWF